MWFFAGQVAACLNPSRLAVSSRIRISSSSAFSARARRSILGLPCGKSMRPISSSENPTVRPSEIKASRRRTSAENVRRSPRRPDEAIYPSPS